MNIDRKATVTRHDLETKSLVENPLLQVGNGNIAFSMDATGLQTFAGHTFAQWGWHSFPVPDEARDVTLRMQPYPFRDREVGYPTNAEGQETLYRWLRENPHRLNLGRFRLLLDGKVPDQCAVQEIHQKLSLWEGVLRSRYWLDGIPVEVVTCCHPQHDLLAVEIRSAHLNSGRLQMEFSFPYGNPGVSGADWTNAHAHESIITSQSQRQFIWKHTLDQDVSFVRMDWSTDVVVTSPQQHNYRFIPRTQSGCSSFVCAFAPDMAPSLLPGFEETSQAAIQHWESYWSTGGFIDLSESRDPRWHELERRTILSQYLMAVNGAGELPPQESGLYNNSGWYGKFHLEMHWWHGAHFALWNRWPLFARSLPWYRQHLTTACDIAREQGFLGARWQKMVGPNGLESPSQIGPMLIWQQSHPIFYAEQAYRIAPTEQTLREWSDIVNATADFLADFPVWDPTKQWYSLLPPLKTMPENNDERLTCNPAFELSYWRLGLRLAIQWAERLKKTPSPKWRQVYERLAPLPVAAGRYLLHEGGYDTYTRWNYEHPSLVGMSGMLPGDGTQPKVMSATIQEVLRTWRWDECWGWDFPMVAMAAARNGLPEQAINMLLHPSHKNQFDSFGLSLGGPYPYFPSNGGLLYAIAMMAAGWDGCPAVNAPGFPHNGDWIVRWEDLSPAI